MSLIVDRAPESVKKNLSDFLTFNTDAKLEKELVDLVDAGNVAELEKRLNKRLEFGTAGLRGPMGAGFSRMNIVTVVQAAQGLFKYLEETIGLEQMKKQSIALGFDARYNSKEFAHATAAIFAFHGVRPLLYSKYVPTPLVAFAVKKHSTAAGVMVTASHNPKQDNGYKVYAANGSQIIPPMDSDISRHITENQAPWTDALALLQADGTLPADMFEDLLTNGTVEAYHAAVQSEQDATLAEVVKNSDLKVAYTAMHGVGAEQVSELLEKRMGFKNLNFVPEQRYPDPEFPTVPFPNPEERGALNLAQKCAGEAGVGLIIANDPDADRLAAAEWVASENRWHVFHGDELGAIFGAWRMEQLTNQGVPADKQIYLCSAVSSKMLGAMAKAEGHRYEETMTGFKWLGSVATKRAEETPGLVCGLAYEEAIGYAVTESVRDKDGVSAAGSLLQLACKLHNDKKKDAALPGTLVEFLAALRKKYGHFVTNNYYLIAEDKVEVSKCFATLRGNYPKTLSIPEVGEVSVSRIRDVTVGYDDAEKDNICAFPVSPDSQMVTFWFSNNAVITLRTSGTEPKLKWYAEQPGQNPAEVAKELGALVEAVVSQWLRPEAHGFVRRG